MKCSEANAPNHQGLQTKQYFAISLCAPTACVSVCCVFMFVCFILFTDTRHWQIQRNVVEFIKRGILFWKFLLFWKLSRFSNARFCYYLSSFTLITRGNKIDQTAAERELSCRGSRSFQSPLPFQGTLRHNAVSAVTWKHRGRGNGLLDFCYKKLVELKEV